MLARDEKALRAAVIHVQWTGWVNVRSIIHKADGNMILVKVELARKTQSHMHLNDVLVEKDYDTLLLL